MAQFRLVLVTKWQIKATTTTNVLSYILIQPINQTVIDITDYILPIVWV